MGYHGGLRGGRRRPGARAARRAVQQLGAALARRAAGARGAGALAQLLLGVVAKVQTPFLGMLQTCSITEPFPDIYVTVHYRIMSVPCWMGN